MNCARWGSRASDCKAGTAVLIAHGVTNGRRDDLIGGGEGRYLIRAKDGGHEVTATGITPRRFFWGKWPCSMVKPRFGPDARRSRDARWLCSEASIFFIVSSTQMSRWRDATSGWQSVRHKMNFAPHATQTWNVSRRSAVSPLPRSGRQNSSPHSAAVGILNCLGGSRSTFGLWANMWLAWIWQKSNFDPYKFLLLEHCDSCAFRGLQGRRLSDGPRTTIAQRPDWGAEHRVSK